MPRRNRNARQPKAPWYVAKHGKNPTVNRQKYLRAFSRRRAQMNREYAQVRRLYLRQHSKCECCIARKLVPKFATEIHHTRGRIGGLLIDTRFFKSACTECHDWIHLNIPDARRIGLICGAGEWNTLPNANQ